MTSNIMEYLNMFTPEIRVFVMSALPIIELRGAIPISMSMEISVYSSFLICLLGSLVPLPFLLYGIRPVFKILSKVDSLPAFLDWNSKTIQWAFLVNFIDQLVQVEMNTLN